VFAISIDESRTVETWTGKRTSKATVKGREKDKAFREAFGQLATLRSFCTEGTIEVNMKVILWLVLTVNQMKVQM